MEAPQLNFDQDTLAKIAKAKSLGYDDNAILQKASAYQASKTQKTYHQTGTTPFNQPGSATQNTLLDLLPLIGAVGGSFIPGLGNIVGGALGAGGATLLKQGLKNEPINAKNYLVEPAKEAAFAGAGGLIGKGIGAVGGKVLSRVAPGLKEAGGKLAAKAVRVNPGQATKFAAETGDDFGKFMATRGLASVDDLDKSVLALQKSFDDVVKSSNLMVPATSITSKFNQTIRRLNSSILPSDKAKAEVVKQISDNFVSQYGSGEVPAQVLTQLRREIDDGITKFALDEATKGPLNLTRDVLQNSLRDTADQAGITISGRSLKDTGVELSKLYKAQEIVERQANLGVGSMPLGLTRLLGGAVGGATGGVPGAIGGMAATSVVNNPEVLGGLSKLATKAGKAATKLPTSLPTQGLERAGLATGAGLGMRGGQPQQPQPSELPTQLPTTTTDQLAGAGGGQQDQLKQILGTYMLSKAKSVGDLKAAYDFLNPPAETLTDAQVRTQAAATSGLRSLQTAEQILAKDPNAPLKANLPIIKGQSPYRAAVNEVKDAFTRIRTGAQINDQELEFYENQLPQFYDSPETIQYKLGIFRDLFKDIAADPNSHS